MGKKIIEIKNINELKSMLTQLEEIVDKINQFELEITIIQFSNSEVQ